MNGTYTILNAYAFNLGGHHPGDNRECGEAGWPKLMRQSSDGIEGWMDGRGRWDGGNLWSFISESLEFPLF